MNCLNVQKKFTCDLMFFASKNFVKDKFFPEKLDMFFQTYLYSVIISEQTAEKRLFPDVVDF